MIISFEVIISFELIISFEVITSIVREKSLYLGHA